MIDNNRLTKVKGCIAPGIGNGFVSEGGRVEVDMSDQALQRTCPG